MKHPTQKHLRRSRWRRLTRWWAQWVEERTRVEVNVKLPSYAELKARAIPVSPRPGARSDERR